MARSYSKNDKNGSFFIKKIVNQDNALHSLVVQILVSDYLSIPFTNQILPQVNFVSWARSCSRRRSYSLNNEPLCLWREISSFFIRFDIFWTTCWVQLTYNFENRLVFVTTTIFNHLCIVSWNILHFKTYSLGLILFFTT